MNVRVSAARILFVVVLNSTPSIDLGHTAKP